MSTFGDLFFNSVVLGGRGRRDAPDDASSSDGCGGDDDVELSLADDDASDGCGAGGEEPAAPDPRATFRDELARPARPPAGGAGFWAHCGCVGEDLRRRATLALSRASDAEEAARFSASEAFEKLCADAYALGGSSDRDDDDRKVGQLCELLPRALKETRRGEDVDDLGVCVVCLTEPRNVALFDCGHIAVCSDCVDTRKRMGGGGAMVKSNTQSVLVLCAHDLPLPKQRTIDDLNEMGTDLTGVYDYKLDAVAAATIDLATSLFAEKLAGATAPRSPGRPEDRVLVVTSGGKDDWRDVLSRAEVLQREFTRASASAASRPLRSARASLEVEGRSGDLGDSAEYTARLLAKRDLSSVTVVVVAERAAQRLRGRAGRRRGDRVVRGPGREETPRVVNLAFLFSGHGRRDGGWAE
ncbi:hypothetical protein JL721_11405 [Aureococcus anophagefferens]|nr:hypothetical protein JL721_11405 [Aureococcus anophagefferens]